MVSTCKSEILQLLDTALIIVFLKELNIHITSAAFSIASTGEGLHIEQQI